MLFSDYLDQRGLILILFSLLAILLSIVFQKYKINKKSLSISSILTITFILGFVGVGAVLENTKISNQDIVEIKVVIDRYNKNKDLFAENNSHNIDYLNTLSKLEFVITNESTTYRELGKTGYAEFRDQINIKLYNKYRNIV